MNGTPTLFRPGQVRYVCVNRKAIMHNLKHGTNYPTAIVVDNDDLFEFHTVRTTGDLSFDRSRTDLPATVFIKTRDEIVGYKQHHSEQSFLNLQFRNGFFTNLVRSFYSFMGYVPVANCLVDFKKLNRELSEPIVVQSEPKKNFPC